MNMKYQMPGLKFRVGVAARRQTAAVIQEIKLSGFLPKAATPFWKGFSL